MGNIQVLEELSSKGKTQQQQYLTMLLDDAGWQLPDILMDIIDIAKNAMKPTPTGDEIEDYKTRLAASKLLLELRWDYTPSRASMNVNLWFSSLIYQNKGNGQQNWWEAIVQPIKEV